MNKTIPPSPAPDPLPELRSATIHHIGNPYDPPFMAILSVAQRLQDVLIETGALEGRPLPFPELARDPAPANDC